MIARQIGLWVFADRISGLAEPIGTTGYSSPLTGVDLVRIGTALLGMYLVITAITYGISMEVGYLARPDAGFENPSITEEMAAQITGYRASYLAKLAFGIALLIGRHRISLLLARSHT